MYSKIIELIGTIKILRSKSDFLSCILYYNEFIIMCFSTDR